MENNNQQATTTNPAKEMRTEELYRPVVGFFHLLLLIA